MAGEPQRTAGSSLPKPGFAQWPGNPNPSEQPGSALVQQTKANPRASLR